MVRLLKNKDSNSFTRFLLDIFKINANIERLIYFIFAFLLLNHLAACLWYWIAKIQDFNPDCWVTRLGYIDSSNFEIYIVSFYWTLTTVTTVGYGDVNAGTNIERVYNLFFMSFGVIMYSFAIGSLSSIVSTLDDKTAEMNQKLQILSSIKKEFNLDQEIYNKVRKLIKYDLSRNQKDKMDFLQELPNKLRIELSQIMHDNIIHKIYFFKDQPKDFIAYLTPLLKSIKFSQNDYLYKCNDVIDEMYFILKGTIILCLSKDYNEKELKEIKKYHNFGEIEMCLNEKLTHNIKVKSRSCELFVLKKNNFLRLSVNFKDYIEKFLQKSLLIYLRFTEVKTNMIKQMNDLKNMENEIRGINNFNDTNNNNDEDDENNIDDDLLESDEESDEEEEEENSEDKSSNINNETMHKFDDDKSFKSSSSISNKSNKKLSEKMNKNNSNEKKSNKSNEKKENNNENNLINENENSDDIKNQLNEKFIKKVNKIIEFLEKNNINLGKNENGIELLKNLININNLTERNEILEKIEKIVNDQFKQKN
jgi:CRP-like cAMP-binding protein